MIVYMVSCGHTSPIETCRAVATSLAILGERVAIVDMSRIYRHSMVALGYVTKAEISRAAPFFERDLIETDLSSPFGRI